MSESLARAVLTEGTERLFRERFTSGMRDAQGRGLGGRAGVLGGIKAIMDDPDIQRRARAAADAIPGLTYAPHLLGVTVATWFRRSNLADTILAGDNSVFATSLRGMLQLLPAATIGAADSVSDLVEDWVNQVSDDPTKPEAERTGQLDRMYTSPYLPGRIFVARLSEGGEIMWLDEPSRIPDVADPDWQRAFNHWRRFDAGRTETRGRSRNRETVQVAGNRFCFPVPNEEAVRFLEANGVRGTDLEQIRRLFQNRTWWSRIDDVGIAFMVALSTSSLEYDGVEAMVAEDQFKDLPDKLEPEAWNRVAARFMPLAQRVRGLDRFDRRTYRAARRVIDHWLGGETTKVNKLLSTTARTYEKWTDNGLNPVIAGIIAMAATAWVWFPLVAMFLIFCAGVSRWILGFMSPVVGIGTIDLLNGTTLTMPNMAIGMVQIVVGATMIFAVTWTFPSIQACANFATFFMKKEDPDWLTHVGQRIATFALTFTGSVVVFMWLGVPVLHRVALLGVAYTGLGLGFGFNVINRKYLAEYLAAKKLMKVDYWLVSVPFVLIVVSGIISAHLGVVVTGAFVGTYVIGTLMKLVISGDPLLAISFFSGVIAAGLGYFQWKGTKLLKDTDGSWVRSRPGLSRYAAWTGVISVAALLAFFWFGSRAAVPQIFDHTVSYTDMTVIQPDGSFERTRTKERESGRTTQNVTSVVKVSKPAPKAKPDLCSMARTAEDREILGCP